MRITEKSSPPFRLAQAPMPQVSIPGQNSRSLQTARTRTLTVIKEESPDKYSVVENVKTGAELAPWRSI